VDMPIVGPAQRDRRYTFCHLGSPQQDHGETEDAVNALVSSVVRRRPGPMGTGLRGCNQIPTQPGSALCVLRQGHSVACSGWRILL